MLWQNSILSFLDNYSSYNQIRINPTDKKKNNFNYWVGELLLQGDAIQIKKCQSNVSVFDG